MKPELKAPGAHLLTLTYDRLLSDFSFCFNSRRFMKVGELPAVRGSSRIQRPQEMRTHTAWSHVHVESTLRTPPNCKVELDIMCLVGSSNCCSSTS